MGLDVSAYCKIKQVAVADLDLSSFFDGKVEEGLTSNHPYFRPRINTDFKERALDVVDQAFYQYSDNDGDSIGSYGYYGDWREALGKMAGIKRRSAQRGPFWELINFSDCEGVFGTTVCKKLALDFATWDDRAQVYNDTDRTFGQNWFYKTYSKFKRMFECAANDGLVEFH